MVVSPNNTVWQGRSLPVTGPRWGYMDCPRPRWFSRENQDALISKRRRNTCWSGKSSCRLPYSVLRDGRAGGEVERGSWDVSQSQASTQPARPSSQTWTWPSSSRRTRCCWTTTTCCLCCTWRSSIPAGSTKVCLAFSRLLRACWSLSLRLPSTSAETISFCTSEIT